MKKIHKMYAVSIPSVPCSAGSGIYHERGEHTQWAHIGTGLWRNGFWQPSTFEKFFFQKLRENYEWKQICLRLLPMRKTFIYTHLAWWLHLSDKLKSLFRKGKPWSKFDCTVQKFYQDNIQCSAYNYLLFEKPDNKYKILSTRSSGFPVRTARSHDLLPFCFELIDTLHLSNIAHEYLVSLFRNTQWAGTFIWSSVEIILLVTIVLQGKR